MKNRARKQAGRAKASYRLQKCRRSKNDESFHLLTGVVLQENRQVET